MSKRVMRLCFFYLFIYLPYTLLTFLFVTPLFHLGQGVSLLYCYLLPCHIMSYHRMLIGIRWRTARFGSTCRRWKYCFFLFHSLFLDVADWLLVPFLPFCLMTHGRGRTACGINRNSKSYAGGAYPTSGFPGDPVGSFFLVLGSAWFFYCFAYPFFSLSSL
ncbi:hypothetical protein F4781DRAFT_328274 [Annulohypoxylon bovei var. microspora]|nr:hypothetical protein F4781DRAFT_328274 [Annulohypoxylon bovei var. microspora]